MKGEAMHVDAEVTYRLTVSEHELRLIGMALAQFGGLPVKPGKNLRDHQRNALDLNHKMNRLIQSHLRDKLDRADSTVKKIDELQGEQDATGRRTEDPRDGGDEER